MRFHEVLKSKVNQYAHLVYEVTRKFPREELFGITSQFRRAALSVALNYTEGYSRINLKVYGNFLEIAYGSLKETMFLIDFSYEGELITVKECDQLKDLANEIGAMLWSTMIKIRN